MVARSEENTITHILHNRNSDGSNERRPQRRIKDKRLGIKDRIKVGTWNVRGLNTKEEELIRELNNQNIDIVVLTETKKKLKGTKDIGNYILIYSGVPQDRRACSGVAILINNKWRSKIISYKYVNERIVTVRLKIDRNYLNIVGVYAPEEGKIEDTTIFYDKLQQELNGIKNTENIIIGGDLNARVGNLPIPGIIGTFGENVINRNGEELRQFATYNRLKITNTFYRKKDIHKYTWCARNQRSLIDYIMINDRLRNQIQDVRVYRGYDIYSDHYLLIATVLMIAKWKKRKTQEKRKEEVFKVYLLEEESIRKLYQNRLQKHLERNVMNENLNEEWEDMKTCILNAACEAIGKKKKIRNKRGLKIWNDEIEEAVRDKKLAYLEYLQKKLKNLKLYIIKKETERNK